MWSQKNAVTLFCRHTHNITKMSADSQIKEITETIGGIEAILKVMKKHIANADVCEFGCASLLNMINRNSKALHNCMRKKILWQLITK